MPVSDRRRPALGHVVKRWLFVVHRWIGIATCLLFAIWFLSGLVMIYVPFPSLTAAERQAGQDPIAWSQVTVQPADAAARAGLPMPRTMTIEMRDRVPVWRIEPWDGPQRTVPAVAGSALAEVDAAYATRVAARFGRAPVASVERIERDQWTVANGFDRHRPLWKAALADDAGTWLYVSSTSGAIVQNSDRRERFWNWIGSVPHWIYPTVLRQDNGAWRQVVMWVSGPCIAAAITGIWIGLLRTRLGRRRYRNGRVTPYRGWMWWHHIAGLTGGVALLTWIFSGWLSVDPGRFFATAGIGDADRIAYAAASGQPQLSFARLAENAPGARQFKLTWAAGRPFATFDRPDMAVTTIDPTTLAPPRRDRAAIVTAATKLVPGAQIVAIDRLTAPDAYWYDAAALPHLPVLRIRYDDPAQTWAHIYPDSGAVLGDIDARGRLYRWLFDLLHKWDVNGLTLNRPAWDILLWTLSILGLVISISGIWIGWLRLTRSAPGSRRH